MTIRWTEDELNTYKSKRNLGEITCAVCGIRTQKNSPSQIYCASCSSERDIQRKNNWARQHPSSKDVQQQHYKKRRSTATERGESISLLAASSIARVVSIPDLLWVTRIAVPFTYAASKNHIYRLGQSGHVTLRKEARAIRERITHSMAEAVFGRKVAHNKLWIDIFVQKPDHKGDAVNVVDLVCDAIKDATGLDDRWFSVRAVDWEIVKGGRGMLYIGIGQDTEVDAQVCSSCGRILPFDAFPKNRSNKLGITRNCRECTSLKTTAT